MKRSILIILVLATTSQIHAQVGIGTNSPDDSAILEVETNDKGFLPPRMTTNQRNYISAPAEGLTIYNTDIKCLQWYNGTTWFNSCDGATETPNTTCANELISVTPCSEVDGATLNDDAASTEGIEYDWSGATGFIDGGNTRALVEINGQCWYRRNAVNTPTAFDPVPNHVADTDVGWSGDYTGGPYTDEGKLYQWSAAMNNTTNERGQGICPTGWHVPSDCEWMYLEGSLGMSITEQEDTGSRSSGGVGTKLLEGGSSGFEALLAGWRFSEFFSNSKNGAIFWTSTATESSKAHRRWLEVNDPWVNRVSLVKDRGYSVRCLKD